MNCDTNPLEAGLDYFIKLNKVAMFSPSPLNNLLYNWHWALSNGCLHLCLFSLLTLLAKQLFRRSRRRA